jgi:hypothetical protein
VFPGSGLTCGDGARSTLTVGIVAPFIVGACEGRRCAGLRHQSHVKGLQQGNFDPYGTIRLVYSLAGKAQEMQRVEGIVFTSCPFEHEDRPWARKGELLIMKGRYAGNFLGAQKR